MATTLDTVVMQTVNIKVKKGDSFDTTFAFTDPADSDAPISMVGNTVLMQVRKKSQTGEVLKTITDTDGMEIVDNTFVFNSIMDIEAGVHFYDIEVTYPDNRVKTLIGGSFTVIQDTSKP